MEGFTIIDGKQGRLSVSKATLEAPYSFVGYVGFLGHMLVDFRSFENPDQHTGF